VFRGEGRTQPDVSNTTLIKHPVPSCEVHRTQIQSASRDYGKIIIQLPLDQAVPFLVVHTLSYRWPRRVRDAFFSS
jgi:hypothetical protein